MRLGGFGLLGVLWVVACGSSDTKSDAEKACEARDSHLSQCGLVAAQPCSAMSVCDQRCVASASCDDLKKRPPSGSYLDCQAACVGIGPDPFVCADGRAYIDKAGRCNGRPECPDGSDETGCGNGGASGSGGSGNGGSGTGGAGTADGG